MSTYLEKLVSVTLEKLTTITKNLVLLDTYPGSMEEILMKALTFVGGNMNIHFQYVYTLDFGALTTVSGDMNFDKQYGSRIIDLSSLTTVGGFLYLYHSWALIENTLKKLESVAGSLRIIQGYEMVDLSFPALESVGGIEFEEVWAATELAAPSLTVINGDFAVSYAKKLESFSLPELATMSGSIYLTNDELLADVSFSKLTYIGVKFYTRECKAFTDFDSNSFPMLTSIGRGFTISNTENLQQISGFQSLTTVAASPDVTGFFTTTGGPAPGPSEVLSSTKSGD